jgi:hypothetical protein
MIGIANKITAKYKPSKPCAYVTMIKPLIKLKIVVLSHKRASVEKVRAVTKKRSKNGVSLCFIRCYHEIGVLSLHIRRGNTVFKVRIVLTKLLFYILNIYYIIILLLLLFAGCYHVTNKKQGALL